MPFHSFHYENDQPHSHLDKILSQSLVDFELVLSIIEMEIAS